MPHSPREIEDDVFRQKEVDPQAAPIVRCLLLWDHPYIMLAGFETFSDSKGYCNNYVDKMREVKKYLFLSTQRGGGSKNGKILSKWQNSVHVVVECPLNKKYLN